MAEIFVDRFDNQGILFGENEVTILKKTEREFVFRVAVDPKAKQPSGDAASPILVFSHSGRQVAIEIELREPEFGTHVESIIRTSDDMIVTSGNFQTLVEATTKVVRLPQVLPNYDLTNVVTIDPAGA